MAAIPADWLQILGRDRLFTGFRTSFLRSLCQNREKCARDLWVFRLHPGREHLRRKSRRGFFFLFPLV